VPIRFVTCCKPAQQERRTKSTNAVGADTGDDSVLLRAWQFFFDLLCEIKLSLQSRAHFDDLIFQKASLHRAHFSDLTFQKCSDPAILFASLKCKSISCYILLRPVHFLSKTFPDRAAKPQKQRPQEPHCGKKDGVSHTRALSPVRRSRLT
jgi:hypothetical protein